MNNKLFITLLCMLTIPLAHSSAPQPNNQSVYQRFTKVASYLTPTPYKPRGTARTIVGLANLAVIGGAQYAIFKHLQKTSNTGNFANAIKTGIKGITGIAITGIALLASIHEPRGSGGLKSGAAIIGSLGLGGIFTSGWAICNKSLIFDLTGSMLCVGSGLWTINKMLKKQ